jgi:hypothetical protein
MTLLITALSPEYTLSASDTLITVKQLNRYIPVDEHFNKHIGFNSDGLTANISYTGSAQWSNNGKVIKLYDVISESLAESVQKNLAFAPLSLTLIKDLLSASMPEQCNKESFGFELHIAGRHRQLPFPWVTVISTYRTVAPWTISGDLKWEYHFPGINVFMMAPESPCVVFGGMENYISNLEKQRFSVAMNGGMDAFNAANLASRLVALAAQRTDSIGHRSVAVLIPREGYLDTNLWDKSPCAIIGYIPRIVFQNGTVWGPSEFPVDLKLILSGRLPKQSLFFKSIIYNEYKRSLRRRIFRNKKGKLIPGLMGLIGLALFGKTADGYIDFSLGDELDS